MVIAAVVVRRQLALRIDRAAEFAAPDDQRVVEQPALLQILNQRRGRLIGVAALCRRCCFGRSLCWSQPRWNS